MPAASCALGSAPRENSKRAASRCPRSAAHHSGVRPCASAVASASAPAVSQARSSTAVRPCLAASTLSGVPSGSDPAAGAPASRSAAAASPWPCGARAATGREAVRGKRQARQPARRTSRLRTNVGARVQQRRRAQRVGPLPVCPVVQQQPHDCHVAGGGRGRQRRLAAKGGDQLVREAHAPALLRGHGGQRRGHLAVGAGVRRQQQTSHRLMPVHAGCDERRQQLVGICDGGRSSVSEGAGREGRAGHARGGAPVL